jgi:hypothetical protein
VEVSFSGFARVSGTEFSGEVWLPRKCSLAFHFFVCRSDKSNSRIMAALVLRIKFPPDYPLIYKTLRIDANLTVKEAVAFVSDTLNIPKEDGMGFYLPDEKKWLEHDMPLSTYDSLQDVVRFFSFCPVSGLSSMRSPCSRAAAARGSAV